MTLVWASGYNGITDPDAQTYIAAVEAADGQTIEGDVALAINDFVVGCKTDGIWDAIKASCILAGARTLSGALVPLKGTAPTNNNFVSGDYNRETGLVGDGSTKYLDSNRANNADPQNSRHLSVYATTATTSAASGSNVFPCYIGSGYTSGGSLIQRQPSNSQFLRCKLSDNVESQGPSGSGSATGLIAVNRSSSAQYSLRANGANTAFNVTSTVPQSRSIGVFRQFEEAIITYNNARLTFYSIGESLDLEQLDTRTTRLMNLISYSLASGLPDLSTMDLDAASYIGAVYRAGGTLS